MKKVITINVDVKELIYDIQNKTYLTGRSREAEGVKGYEAASHIQVSDDEENVYQISRSVATAFAQLKTCLADYIDSETSVADNLFDAEIENAGTLTLRLSMPPNFNAAVTDNIAAAIHEYIVHKAIADWYAITNKADADELGKLCDTALDVLRRALYKRRRPLRPDSSTRRVEPI